MGKRINTSILATILWATSVTLSARTMDEEKRDTIHHVTFRFEQNQSHIDTCLDGNEYSLAILDTLLTDSLQRTCLDSLTLTTYSSIEGGADSNRYLSLLREKNLQAYLLKCYPQLQSIKIRTYVQGEDWQGLRQQALNDSQLPDREDMIALMDFHLTNNKEQLKKLIRQLNQGKAYKYLTVQVFPQLRRVELAVYSTRSKPAPIEAIISEVPHTTVTSPSTQETSIASTTLPRKRRVIMAIKNNLLYDLALAPNIELELPLGEAWSINAEYKCPWWQNTRKEQCYQMQSGGLEGRRWWGNRKKRNQLTGHFLGLYAEGGTYDLQFSGDGYRGEYYIASGLTYGYAKPLGKHLSIEFSLGVGYLTTEYRQYTPYQNQLVGEKRGKYNWIGPTKAKISLAWLITTGR